MSVLTAEFPQLGFPWENLSKITGIVVTYLTKSKARGYFDWETMGEGIYNSPIKTKTPTS